MKFKFLREQALKSEEELSSLKFGHGDIANTVADITAQCDTPFTIGLFGKWGSGKSTIAYKVASILNDKDVSTVIFDVWKHEGDSLKRSFLKELFSQLHGYNRLKKGFSLDDRLESSVTKSNDGEFKVNWGKIKQAGVAISFILLILVILGIVAFEYEHLNEYIDILTPFISFIAGGGVLLWFINNASQFLSTETTTFSTDRLKDPHEFEQEFARILESINTKRILIVFDNLDRVSHGKALEILTTIKTFLEPKDIDIKDKGVVFLIPCDDKAIRAHIRSAYSLSSDNSPVFSPDEFMKKFFNTIVWIPEFIHSELVAFARLHLENTHVPALNDQTLAWLITKAYRDNPRQVIQFVNILLSNYLLILNREGVNKDFETGFSENNKKEICLYLLLCHCYPEIMAKLREEGVNTLEYIPDELNISNDDGAEKSFRDFVEEVSSDVSINNLRPFYTLRRSEQEKKFPGIEQLYIYLEDNQIEAAVELANGIESIGENVGDFSLAITSKLEDIDNSTAIAHFINSLLLVLDKLGLYLDNAANKSIFRAIVKKAKDKLHIISPIILYDTLLTRDSKILSDMVVLWVDSLDKLVGEDDLSKGERNFILSLFDVFTEHMNIVTNQKQRVQAILASHFADDNEILNKFIASEEQQELFLNKDFVTAYVTSLGERDLSIIENEQGNPARISMLNQLNTTLFDDAIYKLVAAKLTELTGLKIAEAWNPEKPNDWESLFLSFNEFVTKHDMSNLTGESELVLFFDAIVGGLKKIPDWNSRKIIMPLLTNIKPYLVEPKLTEVKSLEIKFFTNVLLASFKYYFEILDDDEIYIQKSEHLDVFQQRCMVDRELLDYFYNKLISDDKSKWLLALLDSNSVEAIKKIKNLEYEIPTKVDVLKKILELASVAGVAQKPEFYEVVNAMSCNQSDTIKRGFVDQIKVLLNTNDQDAQKVGYDALLKADYLDQYKREIVKSILDFLQGLGEDDKYQAYAIETVYKTLDLLTPQEKGELIQFCFDYLILKSNDIDAIELGFKILKVFNPQYIERKLNYTDLKNHVEMQPDTQISAAIIEGLQKLKPENINNSNAEYWNWVDSIE